MPVTGFEKARKLIAKYPDIVAKKIMLDLDAKIVQRTPVDTGRARAAWIGSWGQPVHTVAVATDKNGNESISAAYKIHNDAPQFKKMFLTNPLPYIQRLEYGYSKQAPIGMVTISISEVVAPFK